MSKPVIIIGAGGHAKVVANILKLSRIEVLGVVTPDLNVGSYFLNLKVLVMILLYSIMRLLK